jgi:hypothetical protein
MNRASSRAKGKRLENEIADRLEAAGWTVEQAKLTGRMQGIRDRATGEMKQIYISEKNDLFGVFDGLAVKEDRTPILYQVTTTNNRSARNRKIVDAGLPKFRAFEVILFHREDRAAWRAELIFVADGLVTSEDLKATHPLLVAVNTRLAA